MGEYYAVERTGDELHHIFGWGRKKGTQTKNHKYIARIEENGKYRYFYTQAELDTYNKSKTESKSSITRTIGNAFHAVKRTGESAVKSIGDTAKSTATNLANKVDKAVGYTAGKQAHADEKAAKEASKDLYNEVVYGKVQAAHKEGTGKQDWGFKDKDVRETANNIISKSVKARAAVDKYNKSKSEYDKTLFGKAENAYKKASTTVKDASASVSKKTKDWIDKNLYERTTWNYTASNGQKVSAKYKRFLLSSNWELESAHTQTSYDGGKTYTHDNRPHQRKKKVVSGTATVKRKEKVNG